MTGRGRVFEFALVALVLFFVAGIGGIAVTLAGLRKRVPVTINADYDMSVVQVEQFVKTAANRLEWKPTGQSTEGSPTFSFSGPDPDSPLPRLVAIEVRVGPSARKADAASVRIIGLAKAIKPLKTLLDKRIPAVEAPTKP